MSIKRSLHIRSTQEVQSQLRIRVEKGPKELANLVQTSPWRSQVVSLLIILFILGSITTASCTSFLLGENKVQETIIVYSYEDEKNDKKSEENVPTRIRIPKANVTLQEFKERLPRKGFYKYFFKVYDEVIKGYVMEECTSDNQVLPNISKDQGYVVVSVRPSQ